MCFYESLDLLKDRGNVLEKKKSQGLSADDNSQKGTLWGH